MATETSSIAKTPAITISMFVAGLIIAQQVAGKAARDAFFLSHFPASALPSVMIASTALSIIIIIAVGRVMRVVSPARVAPWIFAANACLFGAEYGLTALQPRVTAVIVYLHVAALGATAISVFWSVISEYFDPHSAKRAIARISMGASFGGVVGGVAGWQLGSMLPIEVLFAVLGVTNILCAVGIRSLRGSVTRPVVEDKAPSATTVMRETPYLRYLALLVVLGAVAETVIDFVFKATAQIEYSTPADLVRFFAIFYAGTGLLTFLLQSTLVRRALQANGVIATVATRTAFMLGGGILAAVFPRFLSVVILRGGAQIVENSFYRSGYEILYTPLTPQKKRPTKTMIDVGFERLGVAAGSGLVLGIIAIFPSQAMNILLVTAAVVAAMGLAVCTRLHKGYVDALVDSLRAGSVKLSHVETLDRTTLHTLSNTETAVDRGKLLQDIEAMRQASLGTEANASDDDPTIGTIVDLRSGEAENVLMRLNEGLNAHTVSHALPLLAQREFVAPVSAALEKAGQRVVGQLVDAMSDSANTEMVRKRLPHVLASIGGERAVAGLHLALGDSTLSVREKACIALHVLVQGDAGGALPTEQVYDAICREAKTQTANEARRLGHIGNLLSLVHDGDSVELALRALQTEDQALRGTGLEYLENVVPKRVYEALRPHFKDAHRARRVGRPRKDVVDDLLKSVDTQGIDIAAIRKHVFVPGAE